MKKDSIHTKQIPILITLAGAGLACLLSVLQGADFSVFFKRLLCSVIIFGIIGITVRIWLDMGFKIEKAEEKKKESKKQEDDVQITEGNEFEHFQDESDKDGQS